MDKKVKTAVIVAAAAAAAMMTNSKVSASTSKPTDRYKRAWFDAYWQQLMNFEGGYVANDNGAPANFGINQAYNPDINVKTLTKEKAKDIYWQRYWIPSNAWQMQTFPMSVIKFDHQVNAGGASTIAPGFTYWAKRTDWQNYLNARWNVYRSFKDYKNGKYKRAWDNRLSGLKSYFTKKGY